jgi:hypothetical protein
MPSSRDSTAGAIDWPDRFERTDRRERTSKFSVTLAQSIDDVETELEDRLGVDDWRLSTAAPHRKRDGRPYADANPDDPGAVVRWSTDGNQFAVACDHYAELRDNVRAIGLYIAEKRKMSTRPVTTGQSEFATARLPPADEDDVIAAPAGADSQAAPHEVLDVSPDAPDAVVKGAARAMLKQHHPDTNGGDGDPEMVQRVKEARDALLGGGDGV